MESEELNQRLADLYHHDCDLSPRSVGAGQEVRVDDLADTTETLLNQLKEIWNDKGLPEGTINEAVTDDFAKKLWQGTISDYGLKASSDGGLGLKVDYDSPDFKMLAALQSNVWHFAAAKNYQQLRELTTSLLDENGKVRSFSDFQKAAETIIDKYNGNWLRAEYELAIAGGQMAGKWVDIEANKNTLPYLQFDAVIDSHTSQLCTSLNGTILPVGHSFWSRYYPPNHFNCRSTIRQLASGVVTDKDKIPAADIPEMFQINLAKEKLIFPPDHPYFIDAPAWVTEVGLSALRKNLSNIAQARLLDKTVNVEGVGEIGFTKKSIDTAISKPHEEYILKNQLLTISDVLLKNSTLISTAEDSKERLYKFYYLKVNNLKGNFILNIREDITGKKILYSISDSLKE